MTNLVNAVTNNVDPNLVYIGDKLDGAIGAISTKLGVAADHFWPILVKKQFVDGICLAIAVSLPLIASLICWGIVFLRRNINKQKEKNNGDPTYWLAFGLGCVLLLLALPIIGGNLSEIGNKIFNPEASALTELLLSLR